LAVRDELQRTDQAQHHHELGLGESREQFQPDRYGVHGVTCAAARIIPRPTGKLDRARGCDCEARHMARAKGAIRLAPRHADWACGHRG
jgi:hypothetical protein